MEEKEIKIKVSNEVFERLLKLAQGKYKLAHTSNQKDVYFDTKKMFINNLNRGFRIRFDNEKPKTFEFKSLFYNDNARKDNPWFIEEISMPLPISPKDCDKLTSIFKRLGISVPEFEKKSYSYLELIHLLNTLDLSPKITVTKHRHVFKNLVAEFVFDFVEELGHFIEIETNDGSNPIDLVREIIGEEPFELIRNGYNDMVASEIPYCLTNEIKQQLFTINPKWNVLESETTLVRQLLIGKSE